MAKSKAKAQAKKAAKPKKVAAKKAVKAKVHSKPQSKVKASSKAKAKPAMKAKPKKAATAKKTSTVKAPIKAKAAAPAKKMNLSGLISPLGDRILVQIIEGERQTAGGLIIPDTVALTGQRQALVVAVGPGSRSKKGRLQPLDVKIGDKVLMAEYSGDEIEILGVKAKLVRESEILGVMDSE